MLRELEFTCLKDKTIWPLDFARQLCPGPFSLYFFVD